MMMGRVRKWLVVVMGKGMAKGVAKGVVEGVAIRVVVVVIWHHLQKTTLPTTKTPSKTN